jgi:hypothetical protein
MNEIELKKLWTKLGEKYDIGDWESFKSKMITKEQRKKFYDKISEKMNIGSYEDFEKRLSQPQSKEQEYTPEEKTISITQQQQNLVAKGYFIGTSGPNKNGVDGIPGKKTKEAQHALDSGIDAVSYNTIYKQQNPDLTQTIENLFGNQEPKQIQTGGQTQGSQNQTGGQAQGSSTQTVTQPQNSLTPQQKAQVQKARVIKTIHPKNW